jgi:hypothetical protein
MAITVSRSGKVVKGEDGFVTAKLDSLEIQENDGNEQLQWVFKIPTTKGISDKYLWTGLNINSEKTYYPVDTDGVVSAGQYNRLTQILLSLEIISESELKSEADVNIDLEALIGKTFRFKVVPQKNKPSLSDIDIRSIQLVKEEPSAATVSKN